MKEYCASLNGNMMKSHTYYKDLPHQYKNYVPYEKKNKKKTTEKNVLVHISQTKKHHPAKEDMLG